MHSPGLFWLFGEAKHVHMLLLRSSASQSLGAPHQHSNPHLNPFNILRPKQSSASPDPHLESTEVCWIRKLLCIHENELKWKREWTNASLGPADGQSRFSVITLPKWWQRQQELSSPLCSVQEKAALPASLLLDNWGCRERSVCAPHPRARGSVAIVAAAGREDWVRGVEREDQTGWMTDALWLWLCPLFIWAARIRRQEGMWGTDGLKWGVSGGSGDNQEEMLCSLHVLWRERNLEKWTVNDRAVLGYRKLIQQNGKKRFITGSL